MRLEGRVAVVTGAGQGIGRAVAIMLAAEGAAVVLNSRSETRPDGGTTAFTVRDEILAAGGRAIAVAADVREVAGVQAIHDAAIAQFGTIGILVNNAGHSENAVKPIEEMSVEDWDFMHSLNLRSQFLCTKLAVPHMKQAGWGRILNVSSATGIYGLPGMMSYGSAKAGSIGFTMALAAELKGTGVTANVVMPAAMTPRTVRTLEVRKAMTGLSEPFTPNRTAEAVAAPMVCLCLPEAGEITGQLYHLVAGQVSRMLWPPMDHTLYKPTPWGLDELAGVFFKTFAGPPHTTVPMIDRLDV